MKLKHLFFCLAVIGVFTPASFSQIDRIANDNAIADELRKDGVKYETKRAVLWVEKGGLTEQEIKEFAALVNQGIFDVEKYTGIKFDKKYYQTEKMEYFINSKPGISRGSLERKPFIYLPLVRVKEKKAPYLHETAHKIAYKSIEALWLQEGYASFVQTAVAGRYGGYDASPFNPEKADIDQLARNLLKTEISKKMLPLIGLNGTPAKMNAEQKEIYRPIFEDRRVTAAAFYNLSTSFVKFLVAELGIKKLQKAFESADTNAEILKITGKNVNDWKADWLKSLAE
jgi:hypothetical protein